MKQKLILKICMLFLGIFWFGMYVCTIFDRSHPHADHLNALIGLSIAALAFTVGYLIKE
jgi:low affinity Fe/Cu permease